MQESSSAYTPEGSGRRGLFPRRSPSTEQVVVVSLERAVEQRLEEGIRAIEEQATALMREIAAEMWRASGADVAGAQERILSFLSRDQALKSLIASADERFQTLAVRTARFEDVLTEVADASRATREAIGESARAIREVAESPAIHGVEAVRNQLELVERHIAAAFAHLDERDRAITESIQARIQEHGELIARETTRIVEAMQGYVQSGAEAVGRLAQRVEAHAETFAVHDDDLSERLRGVIRQELGDVVAQFGLAAERIGIDQRDAMGVVKAIEQTIESRIYGVAQLIRSDSQALRRLIEQTAAAQEDRIATAARDAAEAGRERLEAALDERLAIVERNVAEQVAALTTAITATVDHQVALLAESIHERLGIVTEQVAQRAAEAADIAVSSTFDQTLERLGGALDAIESIRSSFEETNASIEERLAQHVDDRVTALAKLMRSDNRVLAERISHGPGGDAETTRQTLRAVKELQASLTSDILGSVDRRFQAVTDQLHQESQSTLETMAKVAEVLADKVDRLSVRLDEGYGNELQIVIERMSDAIRAMSTTGRRATEG
jgi:hypothetical protein